MFYGYIITYRESFVNKKVERNAKRLRKIATKKREKIERFADDTELKL